MGMGDPVVVGDETCIRQLSQPLRFESIQELMMLKPIFALTKKAPFRYVISQAKQAEV